MSTLKRQTVLAVAILAGLVLSALGSGMLLPPTSLEPCLEEAVLEDQVSAVLDPTLSSMGRQSVLRHADKMVELSGTVFLNCRRAGVLAPWLSKQDWPQQAHSRLQFAPSFEYGRYRQRLQIENPSLPAPVAEASARLLASAAPLARATALAATCPTVAMSDREKVVTLAPVFLGTVGVSLGLFEPARASNDAVALIRSIQQEPSYTLTCGGPEVRYAVRLLTLFEHGAIPGLSCQLNSDAVTGQVTATCQ